MQWSDLSGIGDFILKAASAVSLLITAIAAWRGVREYKLKVKAEKRLQRSSQAEVDVRLSRLFAEFMQLADGRGASYMSTECLEQLFENGLVTKDDWKNPDGLREKLSACAFHVPLGVGAQNAAICSLGVLGKRYDVLREMAEAGLDALAVVKSKSREVAAARTILDS